MTTPLSAGLGFFGKLPARADFVSRRLPSSFLEPWDSWLQEGLAASSQALADAWLTTYLEAPMWRFLLAPGACGAAAVIGLLMPSVDRVGRYFPLTLARPLAKCERPAQLMLQSADWFAGVEDLALSVLREDAEFEAFERATEALAAPRDCDQPTSVVHREGMMAFTLPSDRDCAAIGLEVIDHLLPATLPRYTLWWSTGSNGQSALLASGLPSARDFAVLLDKQWDRWHGGQGRT